MNTQTHLLLACAVLVPASSRMVTSKLVTVTLTIAVLLGALLPDASLFVMWGVAKSQGVADTVIWSEWYYSRFWQWMGAITNSIPIYAGIAIAGLLIGGRLPGNATGDSSAARLVNNKTTEAGIAGTGFLPTIGLWVLVFAVAALLHVLTDLPLHHDDGHPHFWPLTNWIFRSPVSYWDPAHYGHIWSAVEILLALTLIVILWRRFNVLITRFVLFIVAVSYIVVSLYWWQLF